MKCGSLWRLQKEGNGSTVGLGAGENVARREALKKGESSGEKYVGK